MNDFTNLLEDGYSFVGGVNDTLLDRLNVHRMIRYSQDLIIAGDRGLANGVLGIDVTGGSERMWSRAAGVVCQN
jgi:hypothetical protein